MKLLKPLLLTLYLTAYIVGSELAAETKPAVETKPAQRIIALSPHSVEMLYAIGAGDKIVATLEYSDYPEAAKKIPRIGNFAGVQIERLVELQPDLVVGWKSGNKAADLAKIESLGLNMVYTQPKNINHIFSDLEKLGQLTGQKNNAQKLIKSLKERYQSIRQKYKNKPRVNVFYQLWHDPMQSVGSGSWVESLINDCGGNNIFNDAHSPYPMVSLESIIVKNPSVVIIPHHSGKKAEKLDLWSKWPEISAVKSNNLYTIHGDLVHRFAPRALDGLEILCEKIDKGRTK